MRVRRVEPSVLPMITPRPHVVSSPIGGGVTPAARLRLLQLCAGPQQQNEAPGDLKIQESR